MKAYWKDIFRTIKYGKKRFFCLMLITALGVTMFTGIRAACDDLTYTADAYYDELNLYDMNIASTLGLTEDDVTALENLEGVSIAEGGYELTVYTKYNDATYESRAKMIGANLNQPYLVEGELPDQANEIAVNSLYIKHSGKQIGDVIPLFEEEVEDQDPFLAENQFTITAVISDPMDVNQSDGNMSWRSTASVDYIFYLDKSAFSSDIYTYVYLALNGAEELQTHSNKYEALISEMEDKIMSEVKEKRELARYEEIYNDAMEEYTEAEAEVMEELADAEQELADGRKELEDGRAELADARAELEDGIRQLEDGKKELADSETLLNEEMDKAWAEIRNGKAQITDAKATLAEEEQKLLDGEAELLAGKAELEAQEKAAFEQIDGGLTQLNTELAKATEGKAYLEQQLAQFGGYVPPEGTAEYEAYMQLQTELAKVNAAIPYLEGEIGKLEQTRTDTEAQFASAWATISENEATITVGKAQIAAGKEELAKQEQTLLAGEATLIQEEADARAQIAEAKEEIKSNEEKLEDGLAQLEDGEQELADAEIELADGEQELEEGRLEAMTELADAKAEIEDIEMAEWYVQTRSSLSGYANVDSDAGSIKGIGTFLSIIFFIVAILVSLTTITRMVEEDRGLIGTYKALGFTNTEVRRKAVIYSASACVVGGVLGDIGGFVILPKIIIVIFRTMYTFPDYILRFDWFFGILGIALFVVGVTLAAIWSCANILRQMPAILMRPQTPKGGSRIFLERFNGIWSRMSFLNKVTARNLFRYKKRLLMTVFGIMGCTALLVCGFGIKNTVTDFMPKQYEHTYEYDIMAVAMADDNELLLSYAEDKENIDTYINVQIETVKLKNEAGREENVQMIVVPDGGDIDLFIHLRLKDDTIIPLSADGITVTRNVSEILEFEKGDTILVRDIALHEDQAPVAAVVENYLGNMIYVSQSYYEANFKEFEANGVLLNLTDSCTDPVGYATELSEKEGVISCISTDSLKEDFSAAFALMNMVVYVVIVLAAGLAFVVLFTLATTNISERSRELATIKVLGFFDKEVHLYVNKETLILSVIGIIVGLPVGVILLYGLGMILKLPGIYFDISVFPSTYLISAVIAFVFTVIVNQITNRLLDVIDPVEALKSVE